MEIRTRKIKKICILTGTRAEYGLLKPIIKNIENHKDFISSILCTGTHLSKKFGHSIDIIKKDGFRNIHEVEMLPADSSERSVARSIGIGIQNFSSFFYKDRPDLLLLLGDRTEALAGSISAAYMNVPIAHVHGGDSARAGLDESARHAITKFSHIHFAATKNSAKRIIKLGEERQRVYVTGAPCLDTILNETFFDRSEIYKKLKLKLNNKFIVLVQHPVSTQPIESKKQILETIRALKKTKLQVVAIYPNCDAGSGEIIKTLENESNNRLHCFKNLSHKLYLSLLKHAYILVGNSSSGIIESSSFKIPSINIGTRQEGRERGVNVIDATHSQKSILESIKQATSKEFQNLMKSCKNPYGNGTCAPKIVNTLSEIRINSNFLQKKITY
jgi:UDP-N-acetylglucosamine 2-epimerase (non-hydrolysing)/GDP/UDP-N,N'-diacetylbacillosamine 2-epimerase (hydrolysing)